MTLDLTKPMRWKSGNPVIVIYHDEQGALLYYAKQRSWWPASQLDYFENIPPEPPKPVGYDEFDAWLASQMPQNTVIGDPHWWTPKIVRAAIRYLRADLDTANAARKVKPLSYDERTAGSVYVESIGLNDWFKRIMAARGIEVGE